MPKVKASVPNVSFRHQFSPRDPVIQNPGESIRRLYNPKLLDDGTIEIQPAGQEDFYAYIQSHKDSVDINVLMKRYQSGDPDALSRMQGFYGDFTDSPETFRDALESIVAAQATFDSLPLEVRERFDHDFNKFIVQMDDMPSWLSKVSPSDSTPQVSFSTTPTAEIVSDPVSVSPGGVSDES